MGIHHGNIITLLAMEDTILPREKSFLMGIGKKNEKQTT